MGEFDGNVMHILLEGFYSYIMYSPMKNDEAQVSWDPLQLHLEGQGGVKDVSPLFLMHKV